MPMDSNMVNGLRDLGYLFLGFALYAKFQEEIKIGLSVAALLSVMIYLLESPGIYAIARRRGIPRPWLAWVPLGKFWLKGCLSDQYQYAAKGKCTNRRWLAAILLLAEIAAAVGMLKSGGIQTVLIMAVLLPIPPVILHGIVLYDLYTSCDPKNGKAYLILSILLGFIRPFLILVCRNQDRGMIRQSTEPAEMACPPKAAWLAAPFLERRIPEVPPWEG